MDDIKEFYSLAQKEVLTKQEFARMINSSIVTSYINEENSSKQDGTMEFIVCTNCDDDYKVLVQSGK